jgi:hypothetical protein
MKRREAFSAQKKPVNAGKCFNIKVSRMISPCQRRPGLVKRLTKKAMV